MLINTNMLKALSITAGNQNVDRKTATNLRLTSKEINESNEAASRIPLEKALFLRYKQIKSEHATIYSVNLP